LIAYKFSCSHCVQLPHLTVDRHLVDACRILLCQQVFCTTYRPILSVKNGLQAII